MPSGKGTYGKQVGRPKGKLGKSQGIIDFIEKIKDARNRSKKS